jgi:hypothetical protein
MKRFCLVLLCLALTLPVSATVNVETTRNVYTGSGTTGPFPYTFKIFASTDLQVIKTEISTGTETVLVYSTDYTVSGAGSDSGGSITLTTALSSSYYLTIRRNMAYTQAQSWTSQTAITAKSLNNVADKLEMQTQQLKEQVDRTFQIPRDLSLGPLYLRPSASKIIGWNSTGTGLTNYSTTSVSSVQFDTMDNYASLATAISSIGSNPATLLIDRSVAVDDNLTSPATLTLMVIQGGSFTVSTGNTLTVGRVQAGPYQIFFGEGSVVFTAGASPILADWFGNDLYKAYNSATADSEISFYDNQTISTGIIMTKKRVSIVGGIPGASRTVTVTGGAMAAPFRLGDDSETYGSGVGGWLQNAFVALANLKIDCAGLADYGIDIRQGTNAVIENIAILSPVLDGIAFRGCTYPDCNLWNVSGKNIHVGDYGRYCLSAINVSNQCVGVESFFFDNLVCRNQSPNSASSAIYLYNNYAVSGQPMRADFKDLWLQNPARHGIEVHGYVDYTVDSGFYEPVVDGNNTHASIWAADTGLTYGSHGWVNNFWFEYPNGKAFPKVYSPNQLTVCGDYRMSGSGCSVLGRKSTFSSTSPGPPNQPVTHYYEQSYFEFPSGWKVNDYYGNEWMSTYNARLEGDNCSTETLPTGRTVNKWRATKFPILVPVTYSSINTGDFYVWYPQEEFVLKNVSFYNNGFLTCPDSAVISFGTADNNTAWIQEMNSTTVVGSSAVYQPVQSKNQSSRLTCNAWRMRSMWNTNDTIGIEDFTANGRYNYIRGYKTGDNCTSGSATIAIDGYYPNYIWQGY